MNTINITGRLTANPELKTTQSGISVCVYNLAVKRPKVKDTPISCLLYRGDRVLNTSPSMVTRVIWLP